MVKVVTGAAAASPNGVLWAQPHFVSGTGAVLSAELGNQALAILGDNAAMQRVKCSLAIPLDFVAVTKAVVCVFAGSAADLHYQVYTSHGADGESYTAHSDSTSAATRGMTVVLDELDITDALTDIAAGDYLGVSFQRNGDNVADTITTLRVLGVLIEYSR